MKITYHWHSFIEIEIKSWSILIDPFITWNPFCKIKLESFYEKDLLAIILTHWHNDHIWDAESICKNTDILLISSFEISQYFQKEKWLKKLHPMHIWWEFNFWEYSVKLTSATHWWWVWDLKSWYTTNPAWVIVRNSWKSIYHAWDTWLTYDMKLLWDYDNIDLAFLPIWWNFTMWIKDSVIATKDFIKPKMVIPIHYDTFDLIKADPYEFVKQVWEIWKVLDFWESIEI